MKDDVGGHLDKVEGGARSFVKDAAALFAAKHGITQVCYALQASSVSRVAVRAIHGAFAGWRLRTVASLSSRGFRSQVEYPVLTVLHEELK